MKKYENSFAVSGIICKDAEIRQFVTKSVARFPISVSRFEKYGDETKRVSSLINVEVWRNNENASSFDILTKGSLITIKGYLKPEEWHNKDGVKNSRIVFMASSFQPVEEAGEEPKKSGKSA